MARKGSKSQKKAATVVQPEETPPVAQPDAQEPVPAVQGSEAVPPEENPKDPPEDEADPAPPPVVQNAAPSPGGVTAIVPAPTPEAFVWTRTKRRALQLTLEGIPVGKIADQLGKHRNTIRNWWNSPEFQAEVRARMNEQSTSARLRQVHRTSVVGEALFTKVTTMMREALQVDPVTGKLPRLDVGEAQLILRELRDYQREEREISGDTVQRIEKHVFISGGGGEQAAKAGTASGRSFKDFLAQHSPKVTSVGMLPPSASDQEKLIEATAELLQETDILDLIAEEDREQDKADAEAEAAMKRKR